MTVPLGEHESVLCVESGVWLVRDDEGPLVAMLKNEDQGWANASRWRSWPPTANAANGCSAELWS